MCWSEFEERVIVVRPVSGRPIQKLCQRMVDNGDCLIWQNLKKRPTCQTHQILGRLEIAFLFGEQGTVDQFGQFQQA
jgi:hypothetical protein